MKIKELTETQLQKRLNYLKKVNPTSRWIKYIKYHLLSARTKRVKGFNVIT
jgi:hypothetical protein